MEKEPSTAGDGPVRATERLASDAAGIARAASLLSAGGLVAFHTETVYGLGVDARDAEAVARLYAAKQRPRFNPLIAHVPDIAAARLQGVFDRHADALARAFWPGALTLVLPAAPTCEVCELARAGLDTVALRVPSDETARALLSAFGFPVVAPSANRSGRVSPTDPAHVFADLDGRIAAVLEDGPTPIGIESTIVACLGQPTLLRPGGVSRASIETLLGAPLADPPESTMPLAPGGLASHYAPRALVRLDATTIRPGEAVLLFGDNNRPGLERAATVLNLSPGGNITMAAARLFAFLRRLDATGANTIAVAPIPEEGLGEAINDRLRRAAAAR